jgi:hypothetical protein
VEIPRSPLSLPSCAAVYRLLFAPDMTSAPN